MYPNSSKCLSEERDHRQTCCPLRVSLRSLQLVGREAVASKERPARELRVQRKSSQTTGFRCGDQKVHRMLLLSCYILGHYGLIDSRKSPRSPVLSPSPAGDETEPSSPAALNFRLDLKSHDFSVLNVFGSRAQMRIVKHSGTGIVMIQKVSESSQNIVKF